jgi:predicted acetyltransferase
MKEFERLCVNVVNDFEIPQEKREALRVLLNSCFPDYFIQREYFKQIPKFRYFVWDEEKLVAQMGVEDRVINVEGDIARIFGVIDLCVEDGYRSHNMATNLIEMLENLGRKNGIDFIILFADDHRLYRKNGFKLVSNICRWLVIDELRSVEIFEKRLTNCFMVKSLSQKPWKNGQVDLLGYLF